MSLKKILILSVVTLFLVLGAFLTYMTKQMIPAETGKIRDGILAVKDGFVNVFFIESAPGSYIAVDAGSKPANVLKEMRKIGIEPSQVTHVFLTHSDPDHADGAGIFTNAVVYLPEQEVQMVNGTTKRKIMGMSRFGSMKTPFQVLKSGQTLTVGSLKVLPVFSPGHTPGSTSYVINEIWVFTGDLLMLKKGKVVVSPGIISMDIPLSEKTIHGLAKTLTNAELLLTSHSGAVDFQKAMADWK